MRAQNTLEKILREYGLKDQHATEHVLRIIQYLFRIIDLKTLRKRLPAEVRFHRMRGSLTNNGYVIKNLKLWLYWCAKNGGTFSATVAKQFQIEPGDMRLSVIAQPLFKSLQKIRTPAMTPEQLDNYVMWADTQAKDWIGKFINHKMKFLQQSYGKTFSTIRSDLRHSGIRCVYLMYPRFDSAEHLLNCYKRSVHNAGINLIQSSTAGKRSELMESNGSFTSRTFNMDSGYASEQLKVEPQNIDMTRFIAKCSDRQMELLHALGGNFTPEFGAWIKRELGTPDKFTKLVVEQRAKLYAKYASVPYSKVTRFIAKAKLVYSTLEQ